MSKYKYSSDENKFNSILKYQDLTLKNIEESIKYNKTEINDTIIRSEKLLKELGYKDDLQNLPKSNEISKSLDKKDKRIIFIPTFEKLCEEAESNVGENCKLESIFSNEELESNEMAMKKLNIEFKELYKLDKFDIIISVVAGLLGAACDILLVGIPQKTKTGIKGGPLSNYIRSEFDKKFPKEKIEEMEKLKESQVPFDAQDNRNTKIHVEGLSAYYHRLLSLGHDPLLGFFIGVNDIINGKMTTIDKTGKIVSQVIDEYADRKESNLFLAIAKEFTHLKSDVATSMGLPVPLMGLFNLLQFGNIGTENQTIAEIVQGMYYEGYDFIHFCSMSIPVMIVEVITRICYAFKKIKEGNSIKDSIPLSSKKDNNVKLSTMLFIAHSCATAINAGKIYFTQNPLSINYPQWLAFAKYSFRQLKRELIKKPLARANYVDNKLNEILDNLYRNTDEMLEEASSDSIIIFE